MLPEHQTSCSRAVIRAIEIDRADAVPVLDFVVQTTSFCGNACVRNHDIEATKVLHNLLRGLLDGGVVLHRDLVCSDFDVEVFCDGGAEGSGVLGRVVPDGNLVKREVLVKHVTR